MSSSDPVISDPAIVPELKHFFPGNSELASRMRELDWSQTDLGHPANWTENLRVAVSLCLTSRIPIVMYWGANFTVLYNDSYISFLGETKHPRYLGQPGQECWHEIWDTIEPMLKSVYETAQATWAEDILMFFARRLPLEEVYVRFTFGPILAPDGRTVEGIFCPCTETTEQVVGARRLETLRKLGIRASEVRTVGAACREAAEVLAENLHDIPFSSIYIVDETGSAAKRIASTERSEHHALPASVSLTEDHPSRCPIASVLRTHDPEEISDPQAIVLPIPATTAGRLAGLIVVGISPRQVWDAEYRTFFDLVTTHIGKAIADAQAYEDERQRAEALAELDRAKTAFFSNVSHEFRTPLTLMLSPLEELSHRLEARLQPDEREQLQLVQRNGLRLQKLVNMLLDFSRIEAGRVQASYESTDLAAYTAELASVFRSLIERAGMSLVIDCPTLPEQVYIDREMWEKIVLNLISNAFKFTFSGSITVQLQAIDNQVELSIIDTGVGIPEAELLRLFERFHRVSGMRSRTYEGSGIGLALVQELVKLHGGTIRVTSQLDRGTTFTIALPFGSAHLPTQRIQASRTSTVVGADPYVVEASRWLTAIESSETSVSELSIAVSTRSEQPSPAARILLADDNADMREYLKRLLSQYWHVETVSDGLEALEAISQRPPDLVLSDVMMPRLDGFGLLHELRTHPHTREIPIILLSARAGEESRIEGLVAGADDYLVKPFSARELLARVEANLKLSRLRQAAAQQEQTLRIEMQVAKDSLENVLTRIADQFLALDREWRYTYVNDQVTAVSGIAREDLLGRSIWEVLPDIVNSQVYTELHRAVAEQTSIHFEYFYPTWNRWFENRVYPSADGVSVIATEITERKQAETALQRSEERYRYLAETIPQLVWTADAEGVLTDINQRWSDFTGLTLIQAQAQGWEAIIHPEDVPILSQNWGAAQQGGNHYRAEGRMRRADGAYRWHLHEAIPAKNQQGQVVKWFGTATDIEAQKQLEQQRQSLLEREQTARQQAETANRIKDEFLAVLSHELRSPLNPILGWSRLLREGKLDAAKTAHALETIERNAKLQTQLIEDLLDVSRILQGKLSLNMVPVELALTLAAAMETVQLAAEAKSIDLRLTILDFGLSNNVQTLESSATYEPLNAPMSKVQNPKLQVLGDSARLQQVIWNLLTNAVKFTPEGGQVEIRLESVEIENTERRMQNQTLSQFSSYAQIQVSDTGKGIDPNFLPHVFEYFRQEDGKTTRKFGGLGLGLAIVHHLVELHGGTIQADSFGEGQGSTFTVRLPLLQAKGERQKVEKNGSSPFTPHPSLLTGIRILLVDDDPDTRDLMAFTLEQRGAIVTSIASAIEALQALIQTKFDLLISDIGMPGMDGYMLIEQIRAKPPEQGGEILAIAVTAYAREYDQRQAIAAGFQRHLAKPVEPEVLVKTVLTLAEGQRGKPS